MADLPTSEEFFGDAGQLPTSEQFFGPKPSHPTMPDWLFEHGPAANVLSRFGQGVAEGWGAEPLHLADDTTEMLRRAGVYNELNEGHRSWLKSFNEALLRPEASALATGLEEFWRGTTAVLRGGQAAVEAMGEFAAHPPPSQLPGPFELIPGIAGLAREVAAAPEAFPRGPATELALRPPGIRPPRVAPYPEGAGQAVLALTPPDLAYARSLGVIGEGEAGWKGTLETGPDYEEARTQAIKDVRDAAKEEPEALAAPSAPGPDIHQFARGIAPDVFRQYDSLGLQKDTLQRQIDELNQMRREGTSPEIDTLDQQIATLRTGRLVEADQQTRRALANEISGLEARRSTLTEALPESGDTPAMAALRQQMVGLDYRMRDLAPDVSDAYRKARVGIEPPAEEAALVEPPEGAPAAPAERVEAIPEMSLEEQAAHTSDHIGRLRDRLDEETDEFHKENIRSAIAREEANLERLEEQILKQAAPPPPIAEAPTRSEPDIHDDVYQQLLAAGRSPEEARASAALVAAHYDARAARFEGARGSAATLYAEEAPKIEAATRGRKGELGRTVFEEGQATIRLMANADASTFVHETAHAWLRELLTDAAQELAPKELQADASAVRNWLGVDEGAEIPTRGHEKFARGFERYLMEGRAPTTSLAKVFDRFKNWLTQIYQTVSRLRAPITDDIRHVYDRLLALPGREPVIAPDMEIPREFAGEHEALAERTPAEFAHGAADRVRAEADRVALERAPEVHDELVGRRADPGIPERAPPGGPPAGGGPGGYGIEAGPERGQAAPVERVGAVGPGGGAAAPEGVGMGATANRPFAPAGTPAETRFTDRAGNIRLDLLGTPEDVNQVIRETAVQNADFIGMRRGVISDAEVLRLAEALGMDAADLDRRKIGQAFNAEEVIAARKLLIQSATTVRELAGKAALGGDNDLAAFVGATDRHRMIQEQVAGITAEAGRALRAFRELEGSKEAAAITHMIRSVTGQTLFQIRRLARSIQQLNTPQQVSTLINSQAKPGFFDWLQSYFVNALISGPATHGTYMVANAELALFKATAETGAQVLVGRVRQALAPAGTALSAAEQREFGEIPAQIFGAMYGQRQGWQAAWRAFLSGETQLLPGEEAAGTAFGKGVIPGVAGKVLEAPSRAVTALHTLTRVTSYESSIHGQAYRLATQEGLLGSARAARINQLVTAPTEEMMQEAVREANENALMQRAPYGGLTNKIQQVTNWGFRVPDVGPISMGTLRPLKFIDPFVAISSNIIKGAILERTPIGLLSPGMWEDLSGRNGTLAFDRAAGRMLAGTSFYLMAGGLAAEGLLTGSGPSDPRERRIKEMTGWQAHSLKIGDTYYSMNRLGILGMQMGIAADLWDFGHRAATEDFATAAAVGVHAFSQNILDESFMRGPSELIQALSDHDRHGAAYVRNFLSSFVPFSVGMSQIARTIDPYTRQARSITDAMIRKIPFASETLEPWRDMWGEPIPNRDSVVPGLLAIYESRVNNDPVNQRMEALGMKASNPQRKIRGVALTDQQYDDYSRVAGRLAKKRLDEIVGAKGFSLSPEMVQREVITKTIGASRRAAEDWMLKHYPALITQASAEKTRALRPTMH